MSPLRTSPSVKKAAVQGYGAEIVECEPTDQARDEAAAKVVNDSGGVLIHPNQVRVLNQEKQT